MAIDLVKRYTSAAGAYVALIVDEEEPDWVAPAAEGEGEDEGHGAEGGATGGPESDAEDEGPLGGAGGEGQVAEEGASGNEGEAEEGAAEGGEGSEDGAGGSGGGSGSKPGSVAMPPDYSKKVLAYVAASAGQEFVAGMTLRRPKPAGEEGEDTGSEGGSAKAERAAVTFRVLDELTPLLQVGWGKAG